MKNKFLISLLVLIVLIIPFNAYAEDGILYKYNKEDQKVLNDIPNLGSKAVYIAEPNTGKVIYEKNAHEKMFPASTTKILTALLVMENCDLSEKTIVSKKALSLVPDGYSNANLKVNERFDIKTLLYALLIPSANEAANVLAEHVSGSVEAFAELCNKRAKELGCENLHFVNPNGIHDENHYCTAYDLYLIAKECRKYDIFNQIVKTTSFTVPATSIYPKNDRTYKNTNEMLLSGTYYYANCTGMKTGFTTPAGECLVGSSSYNGLDLISVVLGGKASNSKGYNERFYDTKSLFEFTYNNYELKEVAKKGDTLKKIKVGKATKETKDLDVLVDSNISTIIPKNEEAITTITFNDGIEAPIEKDEVLGKVYYSADGLVYEANIVASHSVEKLPYALYNTIVVLIIVFTIIILALLFKKSKKKKLIFVIALIVAILEITGIALIIQEGNKEAQTILDLNAYVEDIHE